MKFKTINYFAQMFAAVVITYSVFSAMPDISDAPFLAQLVIATVPITISFIGSVASMGYLELLYLILREKYNIE